MLVQCNKIRDTSIFLNFSNISVKKTIIVALKSDVTLEMLEKIEPIQYKFFEKDTAITHCMLVITKNNSKEFEADGKNELIEIKSKWWILLNYWIIYWLRLFVKLIRIYEWHRWGNSGLAEQFKVGREVIIHQWFREWVLHGSNLWSTQLGQGQEI